MLTDEEVREITVAMGSAGAGVQLSDLEIIHNPAAVLAYRLVIQVSGRPLPPLPSQPVCWHSIPCQLALLSLLVCAIEMAVGPCIQLNSGVLLWDYWPVTCPCFRSLNPL